MCGIMITKKSYMGQMQHRGIKTRLAQVDDLILVHEHLPIQATLADNSIIEAGRYFILFNGEIFGIGNEFESDLHYIKEVFSHPDIGLMDAIKMMYEKEGFFSFIIYDNDMGQTYAFTDPLGKKQLYYSDEGIASEIRPLVNAYTMSYDKKFMAHTIKFGYVTDDSTPYKEIKRIMPNKVYKFNMDLELMWSGSPVYEFGHDKYVSGPSTLRHLIDEAVRARLVGHEKIGLLLSGGLDSSIIYHHIKMAGVKVNTYCVDNEADLKYARLIDPNVKVIPMPGLDKDALRAMEMPVDLGSMYAQYDLFKAVEETVILTGDGADELFGGYKRMFEYDAQYSDIFEELPFYHNIRIDRMSMWHTKEARSPFMSLKLIDYALGLPYADRVDKRALREAYDGILPKEIVWRDKEPLKTGIVRESNPFHYRFHLARQFKEL